MEPLTESWQHGLVAGQFIIAGIMLGAAFLLLGAALFSAQVGPIGIGVWGLVLLSVIILVVIVFAIVGAGFVKDLTKFATVPFNHHEFRLAGCGTCTAIFVLEMTFIAFLLVFG
jgi:hypothetical protein